MARFTVRGSSPNNDRQGDFIGRDGCWTLGAYAEIEAKCFYNALIVVGFTETMTFVADSELNSATKREYLTHWGPQRFVVEKLSDNGFISL